MATRKITTRTKSTQQKPRHRSFKLLANNDRDVTRIFFKWIRNLGTDQMATEVPACV